MSRTGNKAIIIDNNITISENEVSIIVKGPKGENCVNKQDSISIKQEENTIKVLRSNDSKESKQKHGLVRSLLNNAIIGVLKGYKKEMLLNGIGYRVQLVGKNLEFSLGYSHTKLVEPPKGIVFSVNGQNKFAVEGIDKQLVGYICSYIKTLRKVDPYKGKGIFFIDEQIKKKPGKRVKK